MEKIIFISIKNISKYYDSLENVYIYILSKYYNVVIYDIDKKYTEYPFMSTIIYNLKYNEEIEILKCNLKNIIDNNKNQLYFFSPIMYYFLLINIHYIKFILYQKDLVNMGDFIYNVLLKLKYINIWGEVFNTNMDVIGYNVFNNEFTIKYFENSRLNITSIYKNIEILNNFNIFHNSYFPIIDMNVLKTIKNNDIKTIDILMYGSINNDFTYRKNTIDKIKEQFNNYNVLFCENKYDDELDEFLINSKIIIHIPSFENLEHMPWGKIMGLINKKVFFIIEENEEFYKQKLITEDLCYKRDFSNFNYIIEKYIGNDKLRNEIVEKNYNNLKNIKINSFISSCFKFKYTYVFLLFENLIFSSHIFYNNMTLKIIDVIKKYNIDYVIEYNIINFNNDYKDDKYVLFIDCGIICKYVIANINFDITNNYICIIGENYDNDIDSFIGWKNLNITFENCINDIILNALYVTYQNDIIRDIIINLNKHNNCFFCIDGYNNEICKINENKKIDILYYGTILHYLRRYELIFLLLNTKNTMTIIENVFDIDDIINDSKVIIHCNSVDNCYHVPYAKIIKPLINNNIIYCENTEEIKNNAINNYIYVFDYIQNINNYINIKTEKIIDLIDTIFYKNIMLDILSKKNKNIDFIVNSSCTYFLFLIIVYFKTYFQFNSSIFSNHFEINNEYLEKSMIVINITENQYSYIIDTNYNTEILKIKVVSKMLVRQDLIESKNNEFLNNVNNIVENYELFKNTLNNLNPYEFIKNNLNFEKNILKIINYPISPIL